MEYRFRVFALEIPSGMGRESVGEMAGRLGLGLQRALQQTVEPAEFQGWQIVSHNLTQIGERLVLTLLIRQPQ